MKKIHLKTSQNFLHNDMAVLVRPKKSFQIDPKRFEKVATEFKKNLFNGIFY